jgi:hypothetical protein
MEKDEQCRSEMGGKKAVTSIRKTHLRISKKERQGM